MTELENLKRVDTYLVDDKFGAVSDTAIKVLRIYYEMDEYDRPNEVDGILFEFSENRDKRTFKNDSYYINSYDLLGEGDIHIMDSDEYIKWKSGDSGNNEVKVPIYENSIRKL